MARAISSRVGFGFRSRRYLARSAMPGMQKPHWSPAAAANARANRCALGLATAPRASAPSRPAADAAVIAQVTFALAVDERQAAAALPLRRAAVLERRMPQRSRSVSSSDSSGPRLDPHRRSVQRELDQPSRRSQSQRLTSYFVRRTRTSYFARSLRSHDRKILSSQDLLRQYNPLVHAHSPSPRHDRQRRRRSAAPMSSSPTSGSPRSAPSLRESADRVIDATGRLLLPGGVDVHTHLDMPLGDIRTADDFESGTIAAACGGTTTVIDYATQTRGGSLRRGARRLDERGPPDGRSSTSASTCASPTCARTSRRRSTRWWPPACRRSSSSWRTRTA